MPQATPAERRHPIDSLTPRERAVLELVSSPGGSRKAAADALGIRRRTVDHHMSSVFAKLQVDNVAAAARLLGHAERHGAITPLTE